MPTRFLPVVPVVAVRANRKSCACSKKNVCKSVLSVRLYGTRLRLLATQTNHRLQFRIRYVRERNGECLVEDVWRGVDGGHRRMGRDALSDKRHDRMLAAREGCRPLGSAQGADRSPFVIFMAISEGSLDLIHTIESNQI